jgi:hypothetical protein
MLVAAGAGAVIYYALTKAKKSRNSLKKPTRINYIDDIGKKKDPFGIVKEVKHKIKGELLNSSHFV